MRKYLFPIILCLAITPVQAATVSTLAQEFDASGDVSVGPDAHIYASDFGPAISSGQTGRQVLRISPQGEVEIYASGFQGASGNAWDSRGNLYQSSIRGDRVDRITPEGTIETFVSGINGPVGIAIDDSDNVYVSACGEGAIHRYDDTGEGGRFAISGLLNCPNGLTIAPGGNLYAANFNDGRVLRVSTEGDVSELARTPGTSFRRSGGNGHLVFVNDRLYVASYATNQIFEIQLDGTMRVLAGDGTRGHADGPAEDASFSWPNGIAADPTGSKLYVSESESLADTNYLNFPLSPNRLRVITLDEESDVAFNLGHSGSWFNRDTQGQGFSVEVVTPTDIGDPELLVVYWFTFAPGEPGGLERQRWFQAMGPIEGAQAVMEVLQAVGGVFDDPEPVDTKILGTATMTVTGCMTAEMEYELDLDGDGSAETTGSISLERLTPQVLCTELTDN